MKSTALYEEIADRVEFLINQGVLKEGERIPSIRALSSKLGVSVNTVKEAYWSLENKKLIEGVSQSGFFVREPIPRILSTGSPQDPRSLNPQNISLCRIHGMLRDMVRIGSMRTLAIAFIDESLLPREKLSRCFSDALKYGSGTVMDYMISPGHREFREQIALHAVNARTFLSPEDIVITSGCQEAVFLAMMSLCRPGDTIAVESPVYYNFLDLFEEFNLKILEIPSSVEEGIHLETLDFALRNHPIRAVFSIPNFNNPLGTCLADERKKTLVEMVARYDIPLVEDDIYGDISYAPTRPCTCKSFDTTGNVILCSSFSKSLFPGLRIGWTAPGKYTERIMKVKTLINLGANSVSQAALALFLKEGGFDRHLRRMNGILARQSELVRRAVIDYFPPGTTVTRPQGGCSLWVAMPGGFSSLRLYREAMDRGICIAPGPLFSMTGDYENCLRLNTGVWNADVEEAVAVLGELAGTLGND